MSWPHPREQEIINQRKRAKRRAESGGGPLDRVVGGPRRPTRRAETDPGFSKYLDND